MYMALQLNTASFTLLQALTPGITAANDSFTSSTSQTEEYYVTITDDGNFALGCETFYPMGWNQ